MADTKNKISEKPEVKKDEKSLMDDLVKRLEALEKENLELRGQPTQFEQPKGPKPYVEGEAYYLHDNTQVDAETRKLIDKEEKIAIRFPVHGKKLSKEEIAKQKRRRINPEAQYVLLGVNGVFAQYERGIDLKIPKSFFEVWQNSAQI